MKAIEHLFPMILLNGKLDLKLNLDNKRNDQNYYWAYCKMWPFIVQFPKKSIPTLRKYTWRKKGRSLEIPRGRGGGGSKKSKF